MGYIARFRMIKNIPNLNTICGLNPKDKYAEEIGIWKDGMNATSLSKIVETKW